MKNKICLLLTFFLLGSVSTGLLATTLSKTVVNSSGHPMTVWHKAGDQGNSTSINSKKQILLLHGRTWSSLPDFDLQVKDEKLSLMDNLVALGFSVWALDARGYGATPRDESGWHSPNKAVEDVANVVTWITKQTGVKPTVFGWSYGSMVALLMAQKKPALAESIILYGFPIDPEAKRDFPIMPPTPPRKNNTAKNAASDFIVPGSISQTAIDTYVTESLKADPVRADWNQLKQWHQLNAAEVTVPVLLIQAQHDPLAKSESHARFFIKLPNANKQWVVLAGGDHAALLEEPKDRLVHSINNFVDWLGY